MRRRIIKIAKENFKLGFYRISAFLCQQVVERFLKAYLLEKAGEYPFTHSITKLLKLCIDRDPDFKRVLEIKVNILEDYYTGVRYPSSLEVKRRRQERL